MSAEEFDALTRGLANRTISRRRALQLAAAGALGAAGLGVAAGEAEARPTCPRRAGCNKRCTNTRKVCFCIKTTEDTKVCIHPCCGPPCNRSSQCSGTDVCIKSPCCSVKQCGRRCTEPSPCAPGAATSGAAWRS
jgi:hypothetical protein